MKVNIMPVRTSDVLKIDYLARLLNNESFSPVRFHEIITIQIRFTTRTVS